MLWHRANPLVVRGVEDEVGGVRDVYTRLVAGRDFSLQPYETLIYSIFYQLLIFPGWNIVRYRQTLNKNLLSVPPCRPPHFTLQSIR